MKFVSLFPLPFAPVPGVFRCTFFLALVSAPALWAGEPGGIEELFEERIRSVAAVEFFVETEVDRHPSAELGLVADDKGLILLPEHAIPGGVPVGQMKEFKVSPLRSRSEYAAEYLGQEVLNGWHFVRVTDEDFYEVAVPVTAYEIDQPRMGEELWGIAVMDDDFDFEPYYLSSRFSLLRELPQKIGFSMAAVTSPGSLVFSPAGALVGWGGISYLTDAVLHVGHEQIPVAIQGLRESGSFLPAEEFLPYLDHIPEDPLERVAPWIGISSLQPVEPEVAKFLGIADQGGVILSEIIEGSPAAEAGLEKGDIVVAVDGDPIPYYRPHRAVTQHLHREILKRKPGDTLNLTLLRGTEKIDYKVIARLQPRTIREAQREYFSKLGLTVREFLLYDGIARRVGPETDRGLIVQFVRENGPAHTAGLETGDWIQEVDGVAAASYDEAVELVRQAEKDQRREAVFLINRQNETSVVRVRLR